MLAGQVVPFALGPSPLPLRRATRTAVAVPAAHTVSPVPTAPADVTLAGCAGRFAVIRHAVTIPRIPKFRFVLWITLTMATT